MVMVKAIAILTTIIFIVVIVVIVIVVIIIIIIIIIIGVSEKATKGTECYIVLQTKIHKGVHQQNDQPYDKTQGGVRRCRGCGGLRGVRKVSIAL